MKSIIVGNWKNHPSSPEEASRILRGLKAQSRLYKKLSTFIAPPLPYFGLVKEKGRGVGALVAQDLFPVYKGSHTGNVSVDILKNFGTKLVILGHSEKRQLGETSIQVAEKIRVALDAGLIPLLCIGEEVHDTEGKYFEILAGELRASLGSMKKNEGEKLIVAYEPIWAIGKKAEDAMDSAELSQMVIFIKKTLGEIFDRKTAEKIPILYGGSVEPVNAFELKKSGVNGFLVGHASLQPKEFRLIAEALLKKR